MALNDLMQFGHVVYSDGNGNVTDEAGTSHGPEYVYGPEVLYADTDGDGNLVKYPGESDFHTDIGQYDGWTLLRGFTGQDSYNGALMHSSEYIGGGLERYIRENAGYYVAVMVDVMPDGDDAESEPDSWAVAYRENPSHELNRSTFGANTVCDRCGLLPLDDDDVNSECVLTIGDGTK